MHESRKQVICVGVPSLTIDPSKVLPESIPAVPTTVGLAGLPVLAPREETLPQGAQQGSHEVLTYGLLIPTWASVSQTSTGAECSHSPGRCRGPWSSGEKQVCYLIVRLMGYIWQISDPPVFLLLFLPSFDNKWTSAVAMTWEEPDKWGHK